MKKLLTILFFAVLITGCRKEIETGVTKDSIIEKFYLPYLGHLSYWIVDESQPDNNYCYCAYGSSPPSSTDGIRHYRYSSTIDSNDLRVSIISKALPDNCHYYNPIIDTWIKPIGGSNKVDSSIVICELETIADTIYFK